MILFDPEGFSDPEKGCIAMILFGFGL